MPTALCLLFGAVGCFTMAAVHLTSFLHTVRAGAPASDRHTDLAMADLADLLVAFWFGVLFTGLWCGPTLWHATTALATGPARPYILVPALGVPAIVVLARDVKRWLA